jgi:hypothetical protein
MRIRQTLLACILIMWTNLSGAASLASGSSCEKTAVAIPIHSTRTSNLLEVTGSWMSVRGDGTLEVEISLRNRAEKSLSFVVVVANYLDENGSVLFSAPFQANVPTEEQPRNLRSSSILQLNEPVRPGEQVTLTAGRNLLSTTKAAASVEVVYWLARYAEGGSSTSTSLGGSQRGFRTDPLLAETPGPYLQFSFPHPAESVETLLKLQLNEYGRVLAIAPGHEGDATFNREQLEALSKQLEQWHFFPGIENGYAIPSELYVLVYLLPENTLPIRHCFLEYRDNYPEKFAVLTLEPIPGSTNWIPYYGGLPASGNIEPNIIRVTSSEANEMK